MPTSWMCRRFACWWNNSSKPLVSVPWELAAHPSDALIHFDVLVIERIIRVGSPSRWLLDWRAKPLGKDHVFTWNESTVFFVWLFILALLKLRSIKSYLRSFESFLSQPVYTWPFFVLTIRGTHFEKSSLQLTLWEEGRSNSLHILEPKLCKIGVQWRRKTFLDFALAMPFLRCKMKL